MCIDHFHWQTEYYHILLLMPRTSPYMSGVCTKVYDSGKKKLSDSVITGQST